MSGSSGVSPEFRRILEIFDAAERYTKRIEICRSEVPFAAINELRYVGHHLLKGLVAQHGDPSAAGRELHDAEDHCNRAMYEASEAGINYYLDLFKEFERDYAEVIISDIVSDYVTIRKRIRSVHQEITKGRLDRVSPKDQADDYMRTFDQLAEDMETLESSREELNEVKVQQASANRKFPIRLSTVCFGLLVAVVGLVYKILPQLSVKNSEVQCWRAVSTGHLKVVVAGLFRSKLQERVPGFDGMRRPRRGSLQSSTTSWASHFGRQGA